MKRSVYIIIIAIILILSGILVFNRCLKPETLPVPEEDPELAMEEKRPLVTESASASATVYYATTDGKQLLPLTWEIKATTEVARVALEKLLAGPPNDYAVDSIPTDTKLLDIYSIYNTVFVNFTGEFLDIPAEGAQLAVDAVCATVLPLTDGYKLQILVEGQGQEYLHDVFIGEPLSLPLLNPVRQGLRDELNAAAADYVEAEYYLVAEGSNYLVPQTLPVQLTEEEPAALATARALLPLMLPVNCTLNSLELIEGVVCVDITLPDSGLKWSGGQGPAHVEAIVRALTAISGIDAVQFLEQGQIVEELPDVAGQMPLRINTPINSF